MDSTELSAEREPSRALRRKFARELAELGLRNEEGPAPTLTDADVDPLPAPARRFLQFMEVVGRPKTRSVRAHAFGGFRMKKDGPLLPCEAWQFDSALDVARVFMMKLRFASLVPVLVRDTYIRGVGRMRGRVLDAVGIVDVSDERIALGELVTFLNDAVFFAPSMLVRNPAVQWSEVDDDSFGLTLQDRGRSVAGTVLVDGSGAPIDFETTDRFGEDPAAPGEMVRARWTTPILSWGRAEGRPIVTRGKAIWHFASGPFTYADFSFSPTYVSFDVAQRGGPRRLRRKPCAADARDAPATLECLRNSLNRRGRRLARKTNMNPIRTILVPVDFSETSHHALAYAVDLAFLLRARLHVMTAWQMPIVGFPDGVVVATAEVVSRVMEDAEKRLAALKNEYKERNVEIATEVHQGDARESILEVAKKVGADVIVLGTHGRTGVGRWLIGSVAESVVRTSPIPVLTVRKQEKKS